MTTITDATGYSVQDTEHPDQTGVSGNHAPKNGANPEAAALWCPDCRNPEGLCCCWINWLYFWDFDPPPPDPTSANQKT